MAIISKLKLKKGKNLGPKSVGFLEGITVYDVKKNPITLNTLWKNNTVVLKVLRRLGCPLCRYESRLLSELKPLFDDLNIKLAAITFDEVGLDDFLAGGFWEWELYVDKERLTHSALGLTRASAINGISDLFNASGRAAIKAARDRNISGDFKGDGFQLGGTFVIKKNEGLVYSYKQKTAALYPSLKELYAAAGGDPDDVEEQAPLECIAYQGICDLKSGKCGA